MTSWVGNTRPKSISERNIINHRRYNENLANKTWSAHNFFEDGSVHAQKLTSWGNVKSKPQCKVSSLISTPNIVNPPVFGQKRESSVVCDEVVRPSTGVLYNDTFNRRKENFRPNTAATFSSQRFLYSRDPISGLNFDHQSPKTPQKGYDRLVLEDSPKIISTSPASGLKLKVQNPPESPPPSRKDRLRQIINNESTSKPFTDIDTKTIKSQQIESLRSKHAKIKQKKDEERKIKAAALMYEQFKQNCPELRHIESEKLQKHVQTVWKDQIEHKTLTELENEQKEKLDNEMRKLENERMIQKQKELQLEKALKSKNLANELVQQLNQLKERNIASQKLEKEYEKSLQKQYKIDFLEQTRKQLTAKRQNQKVAKFLYRQWKAQLRQKLIQRQNELNCDKNLLEALSEQTAREIETENDVKNNIRQQIEQNLQETKENLAKEAQLQSQIDMMIREKGEQVWLEKEAVWEKQREASKKLLDRVLYEQRMQVDEKMKRNEEKRAASLRERSQLLEQIEILKNEEKLEREMKQQRKISARTERENEIKQAQFDKTQIENDQEIEIAKLQNEQQVYKVLVDEETDRINESKIEEKFYGRSSRPNTSNSVRFNIPKSESPGKSIPISALTSLESMRSRVTGPFVY